MNDMPSLPDNGPAQFDISHLPARPVLNEDGPERSIAMTEDASDPSKPKAAANPWTWRKGTHRTHLQKIIAGTTSGAILSDEAATLASIISSFVKTIEVAELETRLAALEKASAPPDGRSYDA